jgi:uncharacterized repeat protein (TIGR03803 family)
MTLIRLRTETSAGAICCRTVLLALALAGLLLVCTGGQAQTFTVLHKFHDGRDGAFPYDALLLDASGNLYGTTAGGGSFAYGTVFEITSSGKEIVLHSFWGGDGLQPWGDVVRDQAGNLYGTALDGGTLEQGQCDHGCGTVFKLDTTGKLTVLHAFTGWADGGEPRAGLLRDNAGNLFGTTTKGGTGSGVVFKIAPNGKETILHTFSGGQGGWYPEGDLVRDKAGSFYGSVLGGASDYGAVFVLSPSGKYTILYSFPGGSSGAYPVGRLALDSQSNLYGATQNGGGSCYCGVVFKLDRSGHETVLHTFTGNPDGAYPELGIARDRSGNLYGTTYGGGGSSNCYGLGCGTAYQVGSKGKETVLHSFTGGSDGRIPFGGLALDKSGNLYGTAPGGGDLSCSKGYGCGVVFKLTP